MRTRICRRAGIATSIIVAAHLGRIGMAPPIEDIEVEPTAIGDLHVRNGALRIFATQSPVPQE